MFWRELSASSHGIPGIDVRKDTPFLVEIRQVAVESKEKWLGGRRVGVLRASLSVRMTCRCASEELIEVMEACQWILP